MVQLLATPGCRGSLLFLMALASSLSVLVTVAGNTAHFDYLETPVGHLAPAEHEWAQHLKYVAGSWGTQVARAATMGTSQGVQITARA